MGRGVAALPYQPYGPDSCGPLEWTPASAPPLPPSRPLRRYAFVTLGTARPPPTVVTERLDYFKTLLANPRTAFRMMNMCCSGILTDVWWAGLEEFYGSL